MQYPRLQTKGVFLVNCHKANGFIQVGMMVLDGSVSGDITVISPDTREQITVNIPSQQGCFFKQNIEVL
jgi:hypothetical protein